MFIYKKERISPWNHPEPTGYIQYKLRSWILQHLEPGLSQSWITTCRCSFCKHPVPSNVAVSLQCGHSFHTECMMESFDTTPSAELSTCLACVEENCSTPISFFDLHKLMGYNKLAEKLMQLKRTESTQMFPLKRINCTNPGCVGSSLYYDPLYSSHQMYVCR